MKALQNLDNDKDCKTSDYDTIGSCKKLNSQITVTITMINGWKKELNSGIMFFILNC